MRVNLDIVIEKDKTLIIMYVLLAVLLTAACGPITETATPPPPPQQTKESVETVNEPVDSGYPAPQVVDNSGYPSAPVAENLPEGYPAEESVALDPNIPRFQFDDPLTAGMTTVTGKTPPNLGLVIMDITFGGIRLGEGQSDAQGNFSMTVDPLPGGHRVGLTFTDSGDGTSIEQKSQELLPYRGEEFMNVPNVGVFFETTMVQP